MTIQIFNFYLQRKKEELNSSQSIWNYSFSEPFQSGSNSLIFQGRGFQDGGNDPCSKYPINFQFSSVDDQIKMKNWQTLPHHGTDKSRPQLTGLGLGEVTQPLEGRGGELSYGGYKALLGVIFLFPRHKCESYVVPCMFRRFQRLGPPLGCLFKGQKFTCARYVIFAFARSSICMNRNTSNKATFPEWDDNKKFEIAGKLTLPRRNYGLQSSLPLE